MKWKYFPKGIYLSKFHNIQPIFQKWQLINNRITSEWVKNADVPWWYNERASLSLFAGAVWLSGGYVFEEFAVNREIVNKKKHFYNRGRCDIEFSISGNYYFGEAKQCWPTFGRTKEYSIREVIVKTLKAQVEVSQVKEKGYEGIGIIFISPRIPYINKENTGLLMEQFITELIELRKISLAWIFPKMAQERRPSKGHINYRYIFPGTIVGVIPSNAIISIKK